MKKHLISLIIFVFVVLIWIVVICLTNNFDQSCGSSLLSGGIISLIIVTSFGFGSILYLETRD